MTGEPWRRALVAALALAVTVGGVATLTSKDEPVWGLVGGYHGVDMDDLRGRGVEAVLVELAWQAAQPRQGSFDEAYFDRASALVEDYRSRGFRVALNLGVHEAPEWLLDLPGARFVDQHGTAFRDEPVPDLVFGVDHRHHADAYVERVLRLLGDRTFVVRVGGGKWGELAYPPSRPGRAGSYWAFSEGALAGSPVPGWKPCSPSPRDEAARFLEWYRQALLEFQNWQVDSVRRHYSGSIGVLYPSIAPSERELQLAVASNLCGATPGERSEGVPRSFDHARQIAGLRDPDTLVWSTWFEDVRARNRLVSLALRHDRGIIGENSGEDTTQELVESVAAAQQLGLLAFFWVRAETAYSSCAPYASIDDYSRAIRGGRQSRGSDAESRDQCAG